MAIKFQYNKTSLNEITKQLKVRTRALPTLKNKESALRLEVRKAKSRSDELERQLEASIKEYDGIAALWNEFEPGLISVKDIEVDTVKIAGVKIPELKGIDWEIRDFNAFSKPAWFADGVRILKKMAALGIESEIFAARSKILDFQRKKTTQKVNLYEKVQIPGYQEAILKIKRFMEDEENLSKAAQKIVKTRHETEEEESHD
ncbi:V-type ATP synthase subunit D [Muribaculum sp. An289]|uniref:V-type ATP synthase subunit D n=1 Tax=unclassified Muribaculum TaxID=2622126 RepID=UPI000B39A05E|nr:MULTISPECIES: V-type ATP synthase subunit D [unclassified Muribaculum]OUO36194.1 V-type ATP synthase subunit D [Muribaculum sp. An289]OUO41327.1 V-type ATP synthase subunit D [Muribaculum sp. An287]